MNNLFMPEKIEKDLLEERVEKPFEDELEPELASEGDRVLAFAVSNSILIYEFETNRTELIFSDPNNNKITDLCNIKSELYHSAGNKVFDTLTTKKIATRKDKVNALCSYTTYSAETYLYDAGKYPQIYQTKTNKAISKHKHPVKAMCGFNYTIYSVSNNQVYINNPYPFENRQKDSDYLEQLIKYIFPRLRTPIKTENKEKIKRQINSICAHQRRVYDVGNYVEVYETFYNTKLPFQFLPFLQSICSHEGELYGGGEAPEGVYNLNTGSKIIPTSEPVNAIESIPRTIVERYLR